MRTPETLTAVQRAASLQKQAEAAQPNISTQPTPQDSMTGATDKPLDANQKRLQAARNALKTTSNNATANIDPMDEVDGSITILSIDDIVTYSHNPRSKPNSKRAEIKASLQAEGRITNTITVTRRSPKEKYFPYGGGNTRVELCKELFAEGDQRFATLHVLTKKWPGEAAVITAHLSENDNRGDISFWERTQGVVKFKEEFINEFGKQLSVNELNKELKNKGLNYGIKMVQNFIFASENLALIGPWLKTEELNTQIRPLVSALQDLSKLFDKNDDVTNSLEEIMLMHGQDLETLELANKEKDPADRQEPRLDVQGLTTDFQTVVAKVLKLQVDNMPAVIQAITATPNLSIDDIQKIKVQEPESKNKQAQQSPLGGMLAGVTGKTTKSNSPEQQPTKSNTAEFEKQLIAAFSNLNAAVPIADFIATDPRLPFGFFVDFPQSMDSVNGQALSEEIAGLREALWPILASVSGQANEAFAHAIPPNSTWALIKAEGQDAMVARFLAAGVALRKGVIYMTSVHVWMLMAHPVVGPAFMSLMKILSEYHVSASEKFQVSFTPLFS
ncbi:hypothetical protein [Comamonas sp.]|uniref:hypothetical protein n=1 Tax=Comamonas sp. TaxID=34028 RepID=UPI00258C6342|nr:hypothetical protein [Comamonas sp.]